MKSLAKVFVIVLVVLIIFIINLIISKNCAKKIYYDNSLKNYFGVKNNPNNLTKFYSNFCSHTTLKEKNTFSKDFKLHIAYIHFLETKDQKSIENFKFFMDFAYEPCSNRIDYTFIFHTDSMQVNIFQVLRKMFDDDGFIDKLKYCKNTQFKYRLNKGSDLCAFKKLFASEYWNSRENDYQFYFFINSSVRGPFLPAYWTKPW